MWTTELALAQRKSHIFLTFAKLSSSLAWPWCPAAVGIRRADHSLRSSHLTTSTLFLPICLRWFNALFEATFCVIKLFFNIHFRSRIRLISYHSSVSSLRQLTWRIDFNISLKTSYFHLIRHFWRSLTTQQFKTLLPETFYFKIALGSLAEPFSATSWERWIDSINEWGSGDWEPGAFKLDHLQLFKAILFWKFLICFMFILGGQFLLPQRANCEKSEFSQP